jgi:hypothetical protein
VGGYYTGHLNTATLLAQYRRNPHLALALNDTLNSFRLPQANFNIDLTGVQIRYAFNRFLNVTTFGQADTAQTQAVSANFRIRYTFRPDSDLHVIYNVGSRFQSLAAGNPMQVARRRSRSRSRTRGHGDQLRRSNFAARAKRREKTLDVAQEVGRT